MVLYHIDNESAEKCARAICIINDKLQFNKILNTLQIVDMNFDKSSLSSNKSDKINRYDGEINYNSGGTYHYEVNRSFREKKLISLLGKGTRVKAFIVRKQEDDIQIHELLDNGILIIYSYLSHKKITLFAATTERIFHLYSSIGEFPPDFLVTKSEKNVRMGYNRIQY